eukprot:2888986-Amphidinium_carterae.1
MSDESAAFRDLRVLVAKQSQAITSRNACWGEEAFGMVAFLIDVLALLFPKQQRFNVKRSGARFSKSRKKCWLFRVPFRLGDGG